MSPPKPGGSPGTTERTRRVRAAERLPWILLALFLLAIVAAYNESGYRLYSGLDTGPGRMSYVAAFDRFLLGGDSRALNRKNCETARELMEQYSRSFRYVCEQGRWF